MAVSSWRADRRPFVDLPHAREVIWLEPELDVEVSYAEVMQGRLRDPLFRSLVV